HTATTVIYTLSLHDALPIYLVDTSGLRGHAEKLFVPSSETELLEIIADAQRDSIPVTVAGARTGVTGGAIPQGGWIISLEKFRRDRKSTRLNSSHVAISYAV